MGNKKFGKQQILLLIRAVFFIFYPAIFVTAFTGARMLVEEIAVKETLKMDGFVETLIVLCVITILFGRIFCGFFCAFGTLGDAVYWMSSRIQKKRKSRWCSALWKIYCAGRSSCADGSGLWKHGFHEQPSQCIFQITRTEAGKQYDRTWIIYSDPDWNGAGTEIFLQVLLSDGSNFFTASGHAFFSCTKRQRTVYQRLQSVPDGMPGITGTAI